MYKTSLLINTILSLLFLGLIAYQQISDPEFTTSALSASLYVLVVFTTFLWFNYISFKAKQVAIDGLEALPYLKTGKILSVVVIVFAIATIFFSLLSLIPFLTYQSKAKGSQLAGFIIFIVFTLLSAATAIINTVLYRKLIKQNKSIVNSVINTIGDNTPQ